MGELAQVPHCPEGWLFWMAVYTALDPQGSSRVDILTHPSTTAACAAGVVTVAVSGGKLALSLPQELKDTPANTDYCVANTTESN